MVRNALNHIGANPATFTNFLQLGDYLVGKLPYATVMERASMYRDEHLVIGPAGEVDLDARRLTLTRKEFELLAMLARNAGEIVPRDILLSTVWGYCEGTRTRTLDVHVRRLRRKLGNFGDIYIQTVFGIGYRFERFRAPRPLFTYSRAAFAAATA
jgi:DNA-binding response OmpR family regulator